jgi:hypothetical protein
MAGGICQIDFLAGPLDGLRLELPIQLDELAPQAAFPINENIFRVMYGQPLGRQRPPTSVAIYERVSERRPQMRPRYVFIGSFSPAEVQAAGWQM